MIIQKNIIKILVILFAAISIILISYMIPIKKSKYHLESIQEKVITSKSSDIVQISLMHKLNLR